MNHEKARGLLADRLFDDPGPDDLVRLQAHLDECADCRETARDWSSAWKALGALEAVPVDPAAHVRFGRRLERDRAAERPFVDRRPLLAVAAAALLVAGGLVGRALAPSGAPIGGPDDAAPAALAAESDEPRFLLLLRGDEPDRRRPAAELVEEYRAWAGTLAAAGSLVAAEELEVGTGRWVASETEPDPASTRVSGFFLVEAPTYDSAVAIARASPHAAYGGLIEVRRVAGDR